MTFWIFYFLALLPLLVGGLLFVFHKEINWAEWIGGAFLALLVAAIAHFFAIKGMTDDVETLSGQVVSVTYHPFWIQKHVYYTTHKIGKVTYTIRHVVMIPHPEHWSAKDSLEQELPINQSFFNELKMKLGATVNKRYAGHVEFYSGDNHIYITVNTTNVLEPTTRLQTWTNRIKGTPSTFSFLTPPSTIKVFSYPENNDRFKSDRLVGSAVLLDTHLFDQMNSRLGPKKKVNVILVGMGDVPNKNADWQESAWLRGKQNDLVICWGGSNNHPAWVKTFSWGSGLAMKNIQTLILEKGVSNEILPEIEKEIENGFQHPDWQRFDYLSIEIPMRYVIYYLIFMIIVQTGFWFYATNNQYDKIGDKTWRRFL